MADLNNFRSLENDGTALYEIYEYEDLTNKELYLKEFLDLYDTDIVFDAPVIDGAYTEFIVTGNLDEQDDEPAKMIIRMDAMGAGNEITKFNYICANAIGAFKK
jgi:hypothetical protein